MHLIAFIGRPCDIRHILQGQLLLGVWFMLTIRSASRPVNDLGADQNEQNAERQERPPADSLTWNQNREIRQQRHHKNSVDPTLPKK